MDFPSFILPASLWMKNTFIIFLTTNLSGNVWQTLFTHFRGHFFWKQVADDFQSKPDHFSSVFCNQIWKMSNDLQEKICLSLPEKRHKSYYFCKIPPVFRHKWLLAMEFFLFPPAGQLLCLVRKSWMSLLSSILQGCTHVHSLDLKRFGLICVCVFFMIEKCHKPRKFQASLTSTFSIL